MFMQDDYHTVRLTNSYLGVSGKSKSLFHLILHHDQQPGEKKKTVFIINLDIQ